MSDRDPEYISRWLDSSLHKFDNPSQYLGTEPGASRKPWDEVDVRWLVAASWPYYHSTGNQSIPAVCATINRNERYYADRFYLPETPRDLRQLVRGGIPVFGIESRHQMRDFDVVGTSISYAVLWMNFAKMLRMSGIPLRWKDREADPGAYPMVMAGGKTWCAPGFMEPAVDCVFLGEAEDEPGNGGLSQVCARIAEFKADGSWRSDRISCYAALAREFNYLFFPRFVRVDYRYEDRGLPELSRQVSGYSSLLDGMRMPFRSRVVKNLDDAEPLTEAPLLYADPRMGAGDIEVSRGCDAWCSFCRIGWTDNPPRERSVAASVEHAKAWQRNMGSGEFSPFGPDFPMHRQKKRLLAELLQVNSSLDVTAMRIDDFIADDQYVLLQAHAGADGVTLGLEGNSQRMRDLVGKGVADDDVVEAVARGIRAGFRKFKLFMINNFPGEEPADVMRIADLARKLVAVRDELGQPHVVFQFSWTPLLIEAATPFQWFAPTPPDHTLIKVAEEFRDLPNVQLKIGTKAEPNKIALFQLCQRASRDVGEAITDVLEELDTACWGGVPKDTRDRLEAALRRRGFRNGLADCFDERGRYDLLGWEYIDTGVSLDRLWDVYRQMTEFLEGTDAASYESGFSGPAGGNEWVPRCDEKCAGNACGVCDGEDLRLRAARIKASDADIDLAKVKVIDQDSVAFRLRARLEVPPENRYVTREHWRYAVRRAAYRAQHDLDWRTGIAKKTIGFASDAMKHRDWSCGTDYAEWGMVSAQHPYDELRAFVQNMTTELAPWLDLQDWDIFPAAASVRRDADLALWELEPPAGPDEVADRIAWFARQEYVKLVIRADSAYFGSGTEEVNARDWVSDLWLARDGHAHKLRMLVSAKAGPYALYAALAGKPSWISAAARPAVRLGIFSADSGHGDLLRPVCEGCGDPVPAGLLGELLSESWCPRCRDEVAGTVVAGLRSLAYG